MAGGGRHRNPSYDDVVSAQNLFAAWRTFVKGKRARLDVMEFERHVEDRMFDLHDRLALGVWEHGPYETFTVCDPKPRVIHKASVVDRVVHHALVRVIEPLFDSSFIFDSWSCRVGKGTYPAIKRLESELRRLAQQRRGSVWVLKADIRKYFANVDQEVLIGLISRKIEDLRLLTLRKNLDELVWKYLDRTVDASRIISTFASYDGLLRDTDEGDLRGYYRELYRCL